MLENAFGFGGFTHPPPAWWWIIPPGLAIIGLCLAFVFLGYAFDEIVNPRLRRRR
jgi:peptide/nickel transport system permease protein